MADYRNIFCHFKNFPTSTGLLTTVLLSCLNDDVLQNVTLTAEKWILEVMMILGLTASTMAVMTLMM